MDAFLLFDWQLVVYLEIVVKNNGILLVRD